MPSLKTWLCVLAFAVLAAGAWAFGAHEFKAGAQSVQVKWDAANASADQAKLTQAGKVITGDNAQAASFIAIDSTYQKAIGNAPQSTDPFYAAVRSGTVSLRPVWQCPTGASGKPKRTVTVPAPTASSSRPDGTQSGAPANRQDAAADIVFAGDTADGRESALAAKVTALQAVVKGYQAQGGQ